MVNLVFAGEIKKSSHYFLAASRLFNNERKVFPYRVVRWCLFKKDIAVHYYNTQGIVEFMCYPGRQLPHVGKFFRLFESLLHRRELLIGKGEVLHGFMKLFNCIRKAHFNFSKAFLYCDCMFNAGFIAACTAIEFIFLCEFTHRCKHFGNSCLLSDLTAVFGGPVFYCEIKFTVLLIILLPASGIELKHLSICIGADHCPAVILFSVLRQTRAHYASLAAKEFHMLVPYKSCLKLL